MALSGWSITNALPLNLAISGGVSSIDAGQLHSVDPIYVIPHFISHIQKYLPVSGECSENIDLKIILKLHIAAIYVVYMHVTWRGRFVERSMHSGYLPKREDEKKYIF